MTAPNDETFKAKLSTVILVLEVLYSRKPTQEEILDYVEGDAAHRRKIWDDNVSRQMPL